MNPPVILTERLELSRPVAGDLAAMYAIVSDAETGRFLGPREGGMPSHFERFSRNAGSWLLYGYGAFTLRLRGAPQVAGNAGVFHTWRGLGVDFDDRPEAGWILRRDLQGQGYAREAMSAVLEWFEREHGPRPIVCMISSGNTASETLAGRLGFQPLREAEMPDGTAVGLFERPAGGA